MHSVLPTRVGVDLQGSVPLPEHAPFSPHAWGWTGSNRTRTRPDGVLPTRVGVDRPTGREPPTRMCSPHTRGGGPDVHNLLVVDHQFSPHAWGWTEHLCYVVYLRIVLPTRVGVDRATGARAASATGFSPHAWGWTVGHYHLARPFVVLPTRVGVDQDTPQPQGVRTPFSPHAWGWTVSTRSDFTWETFSPHAWGWTDQFASVFTDLGVLPTRVGVDRGGNATRRRMTGRAWRSPHTRGGGPFCRSSYREPPYVLPTRVGVDRISALGFWRRSGSPHTRGGGPTWRRSFISVVMFSPHAWGWTGWRLLAGVDGDVLPTRVGVDRCPSCPSRHRRSFSPHAWGWTVVEMDRRRDHAVLPTRVGVDRAGDHCPGFGVGSPHTRGGGPSMRWRQAASWTFSPHAWGWTGRGQAGADPATVFSPHAWGWTG